MCWKKFESVMQIESEISDHLNEIKSTDFSVQNCIRQIVSPV